MSTESTVILCAYQNDWYRWEENGQRYVLAVTKTLRDEGEVDPEKPCLAAKLIEEGKFDPNPMNVKICLRCNCVVHMILAKLPPENKDSCS